MDEKFLEISEMRYDPPPWRTFRFAAKVRLSAECVWEGLIPSSTAQIAYDHGRNLITTNLSSYFCVAQRE